MAIQKIFALNILYLHISCLEKLYGYWSRPKQFNPFTEETNSWTRLTLDVPPSNTYISFQLAALGLLGPHRFLATGICHFSRVMYS